VITYPYLYNPCCFAGKDTTPIYARRAGVNIYCRAMTTTAILKKEDELIIDWWKYDFMSGKGDRF